MATTDNPGNPLDRWPLASLRLDANGDGEVTGADLFADLESLFFLPGDTLLFGLAKYLNPLARWLDVGPSDYGGIVSGTLSACAWFLGFTIVSIGYYYVRELDYRATGAVHRWVATCALRVRIAHALLRQRWRAWSAARRPIAPAIETREVELSAPELRVLQLHGALAAGYTLSVSEVAQALRARTYEAEKLLRGLHDLGLLHRSLGGMDDETSYALSAAGKALLAARASRQRPPRASQTNPERSRA
jgi:hypothetical protein